MMNNQNQHRMARLTGRFELGAGLVRCRALLASHHVTAGVHASRTRRVLGSVGLGRERRRLAAVVAAALLVTVMLSVFGMGQGATRGILYLTSSSDGGIAVSCIGDGLEQITAPNEGTASDVSGAREILAAAETLTSAMRPYNGENCLGNCRFAR